MMEKLLLIEKRVKARELHKEKGWSVRKISRYLVASRDSISKWIKTDEKCTITSIIFLYNQQQ